jgi:hypothetical protein
MYGNQVLLVMHHRLVLVTLNLGQPAQEVSFTGKNKNYTVFGRLHERPELFSVTH